MSKTTHTKADPETKAHKKTHPETTPPQLFHSSFDKTASARAALAPNELVIINLDIPIALTTVLGAMPRLASLREDIVAKLPDFDIGQFDKLKTYAEALAFAQIAYQGASEPAEALPALTARAAELRDILLSDATALAKRGLLDGKRLAELKGGPGYLNTASDVGTLVNMLRERWSDVSAKTAVQTEELDEAEQLFERITFAYAERAQQSTTAIKAADDRVRAYTLLIKAYDQARRAATYLRWNEGDLEKLVPSLYAGRGGRSTGASSTPGTDVPNTPPAANDGSKGAAAAAPIVAAPPPTHAEPVTPGMPGGSPFTSN